jgi:Tol biopolymer transport system component
MPADCLIKTSECPKPQIESSFINTSTWRVLDWSPDGTQAFVIASNVPDWVGEIKDELFLFDPKTYSLKSLIRMGHINNVAWSPNAKFLAVAGVKEGSDASSTEIQILFSSIFLVSPDGQTVQNLTDELHGMKHHISWLNQETILFELDNYPNECGTYLLNIQNKKITGLLEKPVCSVFPQPSPDGKLIAYGNIKENKNRLYIMDADGSNQKILAEYGDESVLPLWSPNQEWLRLDSNTNNGRLLSIISPDGTNFKHVYQSKTYTYGKWAPIDEPYLLVYEFGTSFIAKWFIIAIPSGDIKMFPKLDGNHIPLWISWRPPTNSETIKP